MYIERALPSGAVLWRSTGGAGAVIPADGCADVIVLDGRLVVAGPSTRSLHTHADGPAGSIGLRFAPGQAGPVLGIRPDEVADQVLPLDAVLSRARAGPWRRALLTMLDRTPHDENTRSTEDLDRLVGAAGSSAPWSGTVRRWAARQSPVAQVTEGLGVSARTLRRRMVDTFGYGYPTLVRIERARLAATLLRKGMSPSEAASEAGYADQPHLTRELRRFVGRSPAQVVSEGAKKSIALPSGSRNVA